MPELPEVETIRRQLEPALAGHLIDQAEISDARLTRPFDPAPVAADLVGERIVALDRRGKYLIVRFASSASLLVHLRMTGSFRVAERGALPGDPHRRAIVRLDNGSDVAYRDVRRFGTWLLLAPGELDPYLASRLGPEPLDPDFTADVFGSLIAHRRAPIKAVILDQRTLAGVGNIYADEALWIARVHPLREAASLASSEVSALHEAIRAVLERGIERQGSTLRDYAQPDGSYGEMQDEFRVYGREDEPCERCGCPIEKIKVAGRGTSYCPTCQAVPRGNPRRDSAQ